MSYIKRTVDAGNRIFISKFSAPMFGNHRSRSARLKESSASVRKCNDFHAAEKCEAKILLNFRPGDWHISLTYADVENLTEERAKKDLRNFLDKLSRRCKKNNITLKYLKMTERSVKGRLHHHLILPQEIPGGMLKECWTFGIVKTLALLGDDVRGLANYFTDKTKQGEKEDDRPQNTARYSFSRNCAEPKISYEVISANKWADKPGTQKGFIVDKNSLKTGVSKLGFPYQRYTLIRTEVKKCQRKNC